MTPDIERLAKEAGMVPIFSPALGIYCGDVSGIAKFAALIAEECHNEIQKLIKPGDLGGNGWDLNAQRNGCILAAQVIRAKFALSNEKDAAYEQRIAAYRAHNAAGLPIVEIIPTPAAPAPGHEAHEAK